MSEIKVSLSLLVPGAGILSSQECDKNPQKNYDVHKMFIDCTKGKGKSQKRVKELIIFSTRKQKMISQNINICYEAYENMLNNPTTPKLSKIWKTLSLSERLKHHFDTIAYDLGAVSYSYEILGD